MSRPTTVIRPRKGFSGIDLREIWASRDLLVIIAMRDVKLRYRQTALGVTWVLLQPLLASLVFTFVFNKIAGLSSEGVPYFLFVFVGMMAWNVFGALLTRSNVLVQYANLVSKVYFPRLVLPIGAAIPGLIDFLVSSTVLVVMLIVYKVSVGMTLLALPLFLILLVMLGLGLTFFASALMVTYRDVQYAMPFFVNILLYLSPVAYPGTAVPRSIEAAYALNPLSSIFDGIHWSVLGTHPPETAALAYSAVVCVGVFLLGAAAFRQMERNFADVI